MKIITASLLTFSLILISAVFFSTSVFAARSIVIDSYKQTFTNDEEGEVKVLLNDFTNGESIFIKGAFSYPDSTNYFGFTKKGDTWVKNSITAADQLSIKIGEWDGKLVVKPDLSDTGFKGSDNYNFKVGFYYYTGGGNLSSVNWSDAKSVNITFVPSPTPTPTLLPTIKPTVTTKPANIIPSETKISTPTKTSAVSNSANTNKISTAQKNISSLPRTITEAAVEISPQSLVLGESSGSSNSVSAANQTTGKSPLQIFYFLIITGIACLSAAIYFSFKTINKKIENPPKAD